MNEELRILLAGFGNMGQALARGWLERGHESGRITVVDPNAGAREAAGALGIGAAAEPPDGGGFDVVVLAVKPAGIADVTAALAARVTARVWLSIAAGRRLTDIEAAAGAGAAVVRAMPNTPAAIGQGMTVLCANAAVDAAAAAACTRLMEAVGAVEWVDDEVLMDAVTAVSGSGPAYLFLLIEALGDAGAGLGLPRPLAARLALETVAGAGIYARESGRSAADLRQAVTSPGGTTAAALDVLTADGGLAELLERAVAAAAARGAELGRS